MDQFHLVSTAFLELGKGLVSYPCFSPQQKRLERCYVYMRYLYPFLIILLLPVQLQAD